MFGAVVVDPPGLSSVDREHLLVRSEFCLGARNGPGGAEHGGAQVLDLAPASGGFVELSFPEAGDYPFVTHVMTDAERGAHGIVRVS